MCDTGRIGRAVKQDRQYARHNPDWPWQTGISHRVVLFKGCWRRYGWDLESTDCRRQAAKFLDVVTVTLQATEEVKHKAESKQLQEAIYF